MAFAALLILIGEVSGLVTGVVNPAIIGNAIGMISALPFVDPTGMSAIVVFGIAFVGLYYAYRNAREYDREVNPPAERPDRRNPFAS